jgi:hypothetical protein
VSPNLLDLVKRAGNLPYRDVGSCLVLYTGQFEGRSSDHQYAGARRGPEGRSGAPGERAPESLATILRACFEFVGEKPSAQLTVAGKTPGPPTLPSDDYTYQFRPN